jgi:hypothetical protein
MHWFKHIARGQLKHIRGRNFWNSKLVQGVTSTTPGAEATSVEERWLGCRERERDQECLYAGIRSVRKSALKEWSSKVHTRGWNSKQVQSIWLIDSGEEYYMWEKRGLKDWQVWWYRATGSAMRASCRFLLHSSIFSKLPFARRSLGTLCVPCSSQATSHRDRFVNK